MRVLVIGANGVLGRAVIPRLVAAGFEVTGLARSPEKLLVVARLGAELARGDILDRTALSKTIGDLRPDAVVNLATSIPLRLKIDAQDWQTNDKIRTYGMDNLVSACESAGVSLLIQESVGYVCESRGAGWMDEDAPYSTHPFLKATVEMEAIVRRSPVPSVILRLGALMSQESWHTQQSVIALKRGMLPIIGDGSAYLSLIHVTDVAEALVRTIDQAETAVGKTYNVSDDSPAPMADVFPFAARLLNAPRPKSVPGFLAKLAAGALTVDVLAASYRMSNSRIRTDLGFAPKYPTYRETWSQIAGALAGRDIKASSDLP